MSILRQLAALTVLAAALIFSPAARLQADEPRINVGTLAGGTVTWELRAMQQMGLDRQNGFRLQLTELAGNPATQVAMLGGEVDAIVSDMLWTAQQRQAGRDLVMLPYSTAVGGLMVRADSPVKALSDLTGHKIGIAGGPLDKSWLILRAWAMKNDGLDLATATEQVFGAPPLIMQAALSGEVDGALNFWHFGARMKAAGMREVISVSDAARDLGLDPGVPLLGYVFSQAWADRNPQLSAGFARASRAVKDRLAADDAAWDALRPIMEAGSDAEFEALRDGWRAGVPPAGPVNAAGAQALFRVMAAMGGNELTGGMTQLPAGLFWQP